MLLADLVHRALAADGPVGRLRTGWEPRPGQMAMAERVADAFERDERLLVEAGTGTGKTLAYLVPAILSGRKVVVATGTKTLQDQIARTDLPRLAEAFRGVLDEPLTFAVMKGLGNYVCLRRLHEHGRQTALNGLEDPVLARVRAWVDETASGDRADLDDVPDDSPVWREVTATPETRLGARCAFFERCFVTNMRRRAADARIILTNHHLFLADLALKSRWPDAQVLPPYEAVVFDEAHQLEEVATEFFGTQVSTQRLYALARDVGRAPVPLIAVERTHSQSRRIQAATDAWAEALRVRLPSPREGFEEVRLPLSSDLFAGDGGSGPRARYHVLDAVLEEAATLLGRFAEEGAPGFDGLPTGAPAPDIGAVLGGLARRAQALRDDLGAMINGDRRDHVRWVVASARNVSLRSSPVDVAPMLARSFDDNPGPLIFTSATLSVAGSFSFVRERLGLADTADEAVFPSPFRYADQALVYLAVDLPDPGDHRFNAAAAERSLALCSAARGRALLLFTSFRALRVAEARFRADGRFPLLVQGERPRHALLEALRTNVGSVLLASQSFWEGVDVPGEALSLVVMDRLPFAVPDDPLVSARITRIREAGGDPFASFQLPQAALALRQGFGRLIRTSGDRGVVAILDGRLSRRSYGSALLSSLPRECRRTEEIDDVVEFFGPAGQAGPSAPGGPSGPSAHGQRSYASSQPPNAAGTTAGFRSSGSASTK